MAYYDDSYASSRHKERNRKRYSTRKSATWYVGSLTLTRGGPHGLRLMLGDEVRKDHIVTTLQFLCEKMPSVCEDGLPSLLEMTSETRLKMEGDGNYCLQMSCKEYAIMIAALLPSYLEPSRRNLKRQQGFRTVAMHPLLMRYIIRQTEDPLVNKWRRWCVVRTLAAFVNATTSAPAELDYAGFVYPIDTKWFVIYNLLPHVLNAILLYYKNTAAFVYALEETTIVYDIMAAFMMPMRVEYINYRLIEEVLNLTELENMHAFCDHHVIMISEVRKLATWVRHFDEHSRTNIKIDRTDERWNINVDMLITTVFNAACDPRLDRHVAMAMMCSMFVSQRDNSSLCAFLNSIPTPCQFNKRVHDLYLRLTTGLRPADYAEVGAEMLRDITKDKYTKELGLEEPPPVYKRPRFPTRRVVGNYATPTFETYTALVKRQASPLLAERPSSLEPLEALYLFTSSLDRNFTANSDRRYDSWDLLSTNTLDCKRLLPLTDAGHYLERSFFYIYKSATS